MTGVQTCALPISLAPGQRLHQLRGVGGLALVGRPLLHHHGGVWETEGGQEGEGGSTGRKHGHVRAVKHRWRIGELVSEGWEADFYLRR